jgi:tetratricopeptide (TPR) repeat protein
VKKLICTITIFLWAFPFFVVSQSSVTSQARQFYEDGQILQDKQEWYSAIEKYQEALRLNPAYGEVWYALAECAYGMGQYSLCITYTNAAENYIKNTTAIQNLRGFALIGLGELEQARVTFLQVLSFYPNDIEARFGLAELDIFDGKYTGAEKYYQDALQRQGKNRKALLSLALISNELGKKEATQRYLDQALSYHSGDPEVHYFAGYVAALQGKYDTAEKHIRTAILLKGDYVDAYSLLAGILFEKQEYQNTVDICDYIISQDRNNGNAWYLKGLSLIQLSRIEESIAALEGGLEVSPQDELMRGLLELIVCTNLEIEDKRREDWASVHIEKAKVYEQRYMSSQSLFEYQRALRIHPDNQSARLAYGQALLREGYPESYLSQLQFIISQGYNQTSVTDIVESYSRILENSLPLQWGIDPFYINKVRWSVGVYCQRSIFSLTHQMSQEITASLFADICSTSSTVKVEASNTAVSGYGDAFKKARLAKQDYFLLFSVSETDRELSISAQLYSANTGNLADTFTVYRTGNDRYFFALEKLKQDLLLKMPLRGTIIDRKASVVLLDVGRKDGITTDSKFTILKKGSISSSDTGLGIVYPTDNELGTVTMVAVGEEISQGILVQKGFYDLINVGDEIIPFVEPAETKEPVSTKKSKKEPTVAPQTEKQVTPLYSIIQSIR